MNSDKEYLKYLYVDIEEPLRLGFCEEIKLASDFSIYRTSDIFLWKELSSDYQVNLIIDYFRNLKKKSEKEVLICAHGNYGIKKLIDEINFKLFNPCYLAVKTDNVSYDIKTDLVIKKLSLDYAELIGSTYRMIKDYPNRVELAQEFINRGVFGGFVNDKCIGFIGMHEEGTMGMLEVLPEYFHRGYGSALEMYLCNHLISENRIPFCHIINGNEASIKLQKKIGLYVFSEEHMVYWGSS